MQRKQGGRGRQEQTWRTAESDVAQAEGGLFGVGLEQLADAHSGIRARAQREGNRKRRPFLSASASSSLSRPLVSRSLPVKCALAPVRVLARAILAVLARVRAAIAPPGLYGERGGADALVCAA